MWNSCGNSVVCLSLLLKLLLLQDIILINEHHYYIQHMLIQLSPLAAVALPPQRVVVVDAKVPLPEYQVSLTCLYHAFLCDVSKQCSNKIVQTRTSHLQTLAPCTLCALLLHPQCIPESQEF